MARRRAFRADVLATGKRRGDDPHTTRMGKVADSTIEDAERGFIALGLIVLASFLVGAGVAKAESPLPRLLLNVESTRTVRGLLTADAVLMGGEVRAGEDFSRKEAEAIFADSGAAVYLERGGRVYSLSSATLVPSMVHRGGEVAKGDEVNAFADLVDRELPGLLDGAHGPFVLKLPATAKESASVLTPRQVTRRPAYVNGVVFQDGFESGLSNWNLYDDSTGAYLMGVTTCDAATGFHSADAVRGGTAPSWVARRPIRTPSSRR